MLTTLIFDLDMTLVDSLEACTTGANMIAERFGLEPRTDSQVLNALSLPTPQFWISLWGRADPQWMDYFLHEVMPKAGHLVRLYPDTLELLGAAKLKGLLLGLATNRINPWRDLADFGIAKFFDTAVGAGDVPRPKPEPDMIHAVIRQLGVDPSNAIYVGDSIYDMACARGAGVKALGLLQGGSNPESLYLAGADVVRPDLASCRDVLDC
jgi:HAD superfamily hydrolase (TIGR01509 family)